MQILPAKVNHFGSDKDFRPAILRYFAEEVAGGSPLTAKAKREDLAKFLMFYEALNGHLRTSEWMPRDSRLFLEELQRQEYAPASINRVLATIRTFGRWLRDRQIVSLDPCKGLKDLQLLPSPPKSVRDIEYHRLTKSADVLASKEPTRMSQDVRNRALLELLNASGLRIHEVLGLRADQIVGKRLVNVRCKGGKVRDVLISKYAANVVHEYVLQHRVAGSSWLFTNRYGSKLSTKGGGEALEKIAAYANAALPEVEKVKVTPHRLRHRHGYKSREAKDPVFAAKRLGHSSLRYIERYATLTENEEEALIEKL